MASIASATGARVSFQARLVARWLWLSWCCCAVCVASVRHSALSGLCLTIHSSRRRFAARLNSGVRPHERLSQDAQMDSLDRRDYLGTFAAQRCRFCRMGRGRAAFTKPRRLAICRRQPFGMGRRIFLGGSRFVRPAAPRSPCQPLCCSGTGGSGSSYSLPVHPRVRRIGCLLRLRWSLVGSAVCSQ